MASDELTLSALGVGGKDRMVMRSLLNLANGRADGPTWQLIESEGGTVTVVDVDTDSGRAVWDRLQGEGDKAIALTSDKRFEGSAVLRKPLRAREFLAMLDRLSSPPEPEPARPAEPMSVDSPEDLLDQSSSRQPVAPAPVGAPGRTLADHLRLQTWTGPIVLTHAAWPMLLIDPGSGAWFFDGSISDLEPAQFARPVPDSAGVPLTSAELVERVEGHRQRPLSELKWFAGLAQMPGKLHPDLKGDVQFMLTQVPTEAMQHDTLHRLAQIVLRGPIALSDLITQSEQPDSNVLAFLNACFASGKLLINRDWRAAGF